MDGLIMWPNHWDIEKIVAHGLAEVLTNQGILLERTHTIIKNQETQMAELDNLNSNVAKLSTDVDALLARPVPPAGVDPAAVQAAADAVAAIDAKVVAATPAPTA